MIAELLKRAVPASGNLEKALVMNIASAVVMQKGSVRPAKSKM